MAVIKNEKTGCWEVRTYYKDILGNTKQKTKWRKIFSNLYKDDSCTA